MRYGNLAARFCLVVVSVLLAALLCEAGLRLLFPKYRDVAQGHALQPDDMRIYASIPNTRDWRVNPATKRRHPFHMNNLGLRQHRNFSDADILSATTVGVFGDSFVRGSYLDAPYVFTEPLDYLLNLDGNGNFTVLNFGMGGYGPAQSYFTYRSFDAREALDYVLFVYYGGDDLHQLARQGLLDLDDDGRLRQREARGSAWWVPFASKLHLTYLALDATGRLAPYVSGRRRGTARQPRRGGPRAGQRVSGRPVRSRSEGIRAADPALERRSGGKRRTVPRSTPSHAARLSAGACAARRSGRRRNRPERLLRKPRRRTSRARLAGVSLPAAQRRALERTRKPARQQRA